MEGLRTNMKHLRIIDGSAEIRPKELPNTSQNRYQLSYFDFHVK
jgi:hypothetical protein